MESEKRLRKRERKRDREFDPFRNVPSSSLFTNKQRFRPRFITGLSGYFNTLYMSYYVLNMVGSLIVAVSK